MEGEYLFGEAVVGVLGVKEDSSDIASDIKGNNIHGVIIVALLRKLRVR